MILYCCPSFVTLRKTTAYSPYSVRQFLIVHKLNVDKTKEMVLDFRKNRAECGLSNIHGERVEIVQSYKYLGTIFEDKLKWDFNTKEIG